MNFDTLLQNKLTAYAKQHEISSLNVLVNHLEQRIKTLEESTVSFEREIYYLKDFEDVFGLSADYICRKYVRTGIIDGEIPEGCRSWQFNKQEFKRVVELVKTKGVYALGA